MKILLLLLVIVVFLGSPVWTSALIVLLPRRLLALALGICGIQALLAFAVWLFYWGGGIGGEAHLSDSWQFAFVFALLPVATAVVRFWSRDAGAEPGAGSSKRASKRGRSESAGINRFGVGNERVLQ